MMLAFAINWVNDGELNSVVSWISFLGGLASIFGIVYSYFNSKINIVLNGVGCAINCGGSIPKADELNLKLLNKSNTDYYIRSVKIYVKDSDRMLQLVINYYDNPYILMHKTETTLPIAYSYYSIDNFINLVKKNSAVVISDGKKDIFLKMSGNLIKKDIDSATNIINVGKGSWIENGIVIAEYVKYLIVSTDEFGDKNYYSIYDNGEFSTPFFNIQNIPKDNMVKTEMVKEYISNNLKLPNNLKLKWEIQHRFKILSC